MTTYEFSENNSGGHWWLEKEDYEKLFVAGWTYTRTEGGFIDPDKPFGGGDDNVPYGWRKGIKKEFASLREAVEDWERITGKDFFEQGCNCCGAPFSISSDGEKWEYISGDSIERTAIRPW